MDYFRYRTPHIFGIGECRSNFLCDLIFPYDWYEKHEPTTTSINVIEYRWSSNPVVLNGLTTSIRIILPTDTVLLYLWCGAGEILPIWHPLHVSVACLTRWASGCLCLLIISIIPAELAWLSFSCHICKRCSAWYGTIGVLSLSLFMNATADVVFSLSAGIEMDLVRYCLLNCAPFSPFALSSLKFQFTIEDCAELSGITVSSIKYVLRCALENFFVLDSIRRTCAGIFQ